MKPGDHPEFFTLPPPEGRSRESTIVLDREGRFFHDGELVEHPRMAEAFASWIDRHPLDGRYILNNGYDWTYLRVEGAPLTVMRVHDDGTNAELTLSDGSREALSLDSVTLGDDGALYCKVREGRFEARFSRSAQLSIEPYLSEAGAGRLVLTLAGRSRVLESNSEG